MGNHNGAGILNGKWEIQRSLSHQHNRPIDPHNLCMHSSAKLTNLVDAESFSFSFLFRAAVQYSKVFPPLLTSPQCRNFSARRISVTRKASFSTSFESTHG